MRGGRSGPSWSWLLPTAERIGADGNDAGGASEPDPPGRPGPGPRGRHDPRRREVARGSLERRSEDDHRRDRCPCCVKRAIRSTRVRSTATARWKSTASGPVGDALISRVIAQVRASQAGRAPIERRISRFAAIYTPLVIAPVASGHAWSTSLRLGHGRTRCRRLGSVAANGLGAGSSCWSSPARVPW